MNTMYRPAPEKLNDYEKDIRKFAFTFTASTEFISYFLIVPLLFIYVAVNLDMTTAQVILFLKICVIAFTVSFATTTINNMMVIKPIVNYFNGILNGRDIPHDEYKKVQVRFFNLPYIHAVGAFFRWVIGLSMAFVPLMLIESFTFIQKYNICMLVLIIALFGSVLYFLLTELFIQKILNRGVFPVIAINKQTFTMNFVKRIILTILTIYLLPVSAIISYFLLVLEHENPGEYFSFVRLGCIIFFGIVFSLALGFALIRTISVKISIIVNFVECMETGDFSVESDIIAVMDELTRVNQTLSFMKNSVQTMLLDIKDASELLSMSTTEISNITVSFSTDTQNQAATVEEVTATMEEISASLENISGGAHEQISSVAALSTRIGELSETIHEMDHMTSDARNMVSVISDQVKTGGESLNKMDENMENISQSSEQMTEIISIINDISDKINLLSLNASIEAARAGEAGRGFAVVADEISKLADGTASSVKEIDALIKNSEIEIAQGKAYAREVVNGMATIIEGVEKINTMSLKINDYVKEQTNSNAMVEDELKLVKIKSEEIERSTSEQKAAMSEVVESVSRINSLTQSISSGAEEIAANSKELAGMAEKQKNMVDRFKLIQ